ncbi:zinc ribbon-containing protein [bacterium]|nr:zinc ribbon-containing protein [bacterium]
MSKKQEKKKSFRDFQEDFVILLEEGFRTAGRITKREFDRTAETIKAKLENKYGKEKVEDFSNRVKADWEQTVQKVQEMRIRLEADTSFRKGKQIGVQFLEGLASAIKRAADNLEASLSDKPTYHAGQVVDKGVFVCAGCSKIQEVKRRRKISVCPECGGSEFRMA